MYAAAADGSMRCVTRAEKAETRARCRGSSEAEAGTSGPARQSTRGRRALPDGEGRLIDISFTRS